MTNHAPQMAKRYARRTTPHLQLVPRQLAPRSRSLCNEELWLDYKLRSDMHRLPQWYTQCDGPTGRERALAPDAVYSY